MAQQRKKLAEAFRAADTNGDGQLDLDEFVDHFKSMGVNLSQDEAKSLFEGKDRDLDNAISFEEFAGIETDSEKAWKAFGGKNQGLTRHEMTQGLKRYKRSLSKIIKNESQFLAR